MIKKSPAGTRQSLPHWADIQSSSGKKQLLKPRKNSSFGVKCRVKRFNKVRLPRSPIKVSMPTCHPQTRQALVIPMLKRQNVSWVFVAQIQAKPHRKIRLMSIDAIKAENIMCGFLDRNVKRFYIMLNL